MFRRDKVNAGPEGLWGSEVHMGESKVLERSTKGSLFDLVISDGDLHVTEG